MSAAKKPPCSASGSQFRASSTASGFALPSPIGVVVSVSDTELPAVFRAVESERPDEQPGKQAASRSIHKPIRGERFSMEDLSLSSEIGGSASGRDYILRAGEDDTFGNAHTNPRREF